MQIEGNSDTGAARAWTPREQLKSRSPPHRRGGATALRITSGNFGTRPRLRPNPSRVDTTPPGGSEMRIPPSPTTVAVSLVLGHFFFTPLFVGDVF